LFEDPPVNMAGERKRRQRSRTRGIGNQRASKLHKTWGRNGLQAIRKGGGGTFSGGKTKKRGGGVHTEACSDGLGEGGDDEEKRHERRVMKIERLTGRASTEWAVKCSQKSEEGEIIMLKPPLRYRTRPASWKNTLEELTTRYRGCEGGKYGRRKCIS